MALPKLEVVSYTTTLPITKKKVTYRPFLVKEQKILLIALESEDSEQATSSMLELMKNCVLNLDKVGLLEKLPTTDIEHLFIQVRIKSVGETVDVGIPCDNCEEVAEISVDLTEAKVEGEVPNPKIELVNDIGMTLSYPTMLSVQNQTPDDKDQTEQIFNLIYESVVNVYQGDAVYTKDDMERNELEEFLDQFTTEQFQKVQDYFTNMPQYSKTINFDCPKCETKNEKKLVGIMDFFG